MATPRAASRTTLSAADVLNGSQSIVERMRVYLDDPVLERIRPKDMPWACEDEESRIGESTVHTLSAIILFCSLTFHFARRTGFRVFANLNLHFSPDRPTLFITPDIMVVNPPGPLPEQLPSYRIGEQGPAPLLVGEVLSPRTYREGDLDRKPIQYGEIGVDEYLVADVTGDMLRRRLVILQRQPAGSWREEQDEDGGITSRLGFRVVIEEDGQLRVIETQTGRRYARPGEAQAAADRVRELEEEVARLRRAAPKAKKGKGRRRKS